jgi:hypothetical protein
MSWVITGSQPFPAVIGEAFGGGFFAGYISHTADGNPTHALIVAPRATGATGTGYTLTTSLAWKTATTTTTGTTSTFDGAANTTAIVQAGIANHAAAQFCVNLNIGNFTDWYLPSHLELDIAYFNLKPSTAQNNTTFGANAYAVPSRAANASLDYPEQSYLSIFTTGGSEAFVDAYHWSSTAPSATLANRRTFADGTLLGTLKTAAERVRAFRRITL